MVRARAAGVVLAFALLAAGCTVLGPPLPSATTTTTTATATPACGTTVTTDLVLASDMTCAQTALVVGADGVTIDLNGHAIRAAGAEPNSVGVDSGDVGGLPAHSFTIQNGIIAGFEIGVDVHDANFGLQHVSIDHVHFVVKNIGVSLYGVGDNTITHSTFEGSGTSPSRTGILLGFKGDGGPDNFAFDNFNHLGFGVSTFNWNETTIEHSWFVHDDTGIYLIESDGFTIRNNDIGYGRHGVEIPQANQDHLVTQNTVHDNQVGVLITNNSESGTPGDADNTVSGNTLSNNGAAGLAVIASAGVTNLVIRNNTANGNGASPGDATNAPIGTAPLNDGIYVNVASGSSATLASNHANYNADRGIQAVGALDGANNTASGNGHSPQCVGVACS